MIKIRTLSNILISNLDENFKTGNEGMKRGPLVHTTSNLDASSPVIFHIILGGESSSKPQPTTKNKNRSLSLCIFGGFLMIA